MASKAGHKYNWNETKNGEKEARACGKWQIFRCGTFGDQVSYCVFLISSWSGFFQKGFLLVGTSHLLFLLYEFPFLFFSFYFSQFQVSCLAMGTTRSKFFFQRGIRSSLEYHLEKIPDFGIWTCTTSRSRTYELNKLQSNIVQRQKRD